MEVEAFVTTYTENALTAAASGEVGVPSWERVLRLQFLPVLRIPSAVEAGYDQNLMFLNLEEDSIGKAPDARTPSPAIDDRKLQGVFGNRLNRSLYSPRKAFPKLRAYISIPSVCLL